jgi:hypothetical protein
VDDGRKGDGSDEVQVVRGYCLFASRGAGRVGEKREWEGYVCVCKIDSSIGTSNHTLMEWRFLDSNRGFLSILWCLLNSMVKSVSVTVSQNRRYKDKRQGEGERSERVKGEVT